MSIFIKRVNNQRCIVSGNVLLGNIYDHRARFGKKGHESIQAQWAIAWVTGRVDWFETYTQARDDALKGNDRAAELGFALGGQPAKAVAA